MRSEASDTGLEQIARHLHSTRPTAVNLARAIDRLFRRLHPLAPAHRADAIAMPQAVGAPGA
jgi:methylthioribose-1-phosphate isomerase